MADFDLDAFIAENSAATAPPPRERRRPPPAAAPVTGEYLPPAKPSARVATTGELGRAPTSAAEFSLDLDDFIATGGAEDVGDVEAFGRGALQGVSFGFADELAGLVDAGFTSKTYEQGRDEAREINLHAQRQHGGWYTAGEIAGSVAVPGLGAGGLAGKAGLRGVKAIAAAGAAEGALQGFGAAEGGVSEHVRGALLGGLAGGVTAGLVGKATSSFVAGAERRAARDITKELAEGATPTHQRRFADIQELALQELAPDKAFMKAARGKVDEAAEVAAGRAKKFGGETKPIYSKLDKEVGEIPIAKVVQRLDNDIARAAQDFGDDGTDLVLEEVRNRFVAKAKAKYGEGATSVPHSEVRKWVTGLLKHKTRVMGSISETENFAFAAKAHDVADDILKGHLDDVRKIRPDLAPDLEKLTGLNRKIRAYASAEALMANKAGREFWKRESNRFVTGATGALGLAGYAATGNILGATAALIPPGFRLVARTFSGASKRATAAIARLQITARKGNVTKQAILDAVSAGVPMAIAQATVAGAKGAQRAIAEIQAGGEE